MVIDKEMPSAFQKDQKQKKDKPILEKLKHEKSTSLFLTGIEDKEVR